MPSTTKRSSRAPSWRSVAKKRQKYRTLALYTGVFVLVMAFVAAGYRPPEYTDSTASAADGLLSKDNVAAPTIDEVVAANVAADIATTVNLPIAANVSNLSQSLSAQNALAQSDNNVVAKPQVVAPTSGNRTIITYTTKVGDTTESVASQYGISAQTIRWANNLTSDALTPDKTIKILPVDGILYTVKGGETIASLADKYKASADQIKLYNDLDLAQSLAAGRELIIPSGTLPDTERPGYVAPTYSGNTNGLTSSYGGGYGTNNTYSASVGNRYSYGQCTWYAYERRVQLGNPVGSFWGNASTWAYYGRLAGFRVDQSPEVGAVMQNGGGYFGHVAIVEAVNPGVSVTISEMNAYRFGGGYARIGHGDISWSDAVSGYYSYIH